MPVEFNYLKAAADYQKQRPEFVHVHGPVMRSGNTQADVGKPGINPHLVSVYIFIKIMSIIRYYYLEFEYEMERREWVWQGRKKGSHNLIVLAILY